MARAQLGAGSAPVYSVMSEEGYTVSTDPSRLDLNYIHAFLSTAYWARGIPRPVMERAIKNSLPFGLYDPIGSQIGFARVITDYATYAYVADVFVDERERGRGLGLFLVGSAIAHPELSNLRRWFLSTLDAHDLYRQLGFDAPPHPERLMAIERPIAELWPEKDA